jgi:hypothetical protein
MVHAAASSRLEGFGLISAARKCACFGAAICKGRYLARRAQLIRRLVTEGTGEIDLVLDQKVSIRSGHQWSGEEGGVERSGLGD